MIKLRKLYEDADAAKVDSERFPMKLSAVDKETAAKVTASGDKDGEETDDTIQVSEKTYPVEKLKPSQSSMNIDKAMGMALSMILGEMQTGGDLGAFISNDMHIMDGHHRWVATAMVDPSKEVGGYQVNFPGKELIAVLNALTKGQYGVDKGKPATGGFDQFKEAPIRKTLENYMKSGSKFLKPEDVEKAVTKFGGDVDGAVAKFVEHIGKLSFKLPEGAPSREDMPVIDEPDVPKTVAALKGGYVDVNPPYAQTEESFKQKGTKLNETIDKSRWKKIANIKGK